VITALPFQYTLTHAVRMPLRQTYCTRGAFQYTLTHAFRIVLCLIAIVVFFHQAQISVAQPRLLWEARYNGTADGDDFGRAMSVDAEGNVYMAGSAMNAGTGRDFTVVKYNSFGQFVWSVSYDASLNEDDWAHALVMDTRGFIYATGFCQTKDEGKNFLTMKCNREGDVLWVREYNGPAGGNDVAEHIAVDEAGNVFVTGSSQGHASSSDYMTLMYDSEGQLQWEARYNGPGNGVDEARSIAVDPNGGVCVSGGSTGVNGDYDIATIKYDQFGQVQWIARYDGPGNGDDIVYYKGAVVIDEQACVYVAGYSVGLDSSIDYATIKYNADGELLWVARYANPAGTADYANTIALDREGNVYTSGGSDNVGSGVDFLTLKYSPDGIMLWKAEYNGAANDWDEAYALLIDDSLNVYVAGRSVGVASSADMVVVKYNEHGEMLWEARHEQAKGYDWPFAICRDAEGDIYVGGYGYAFSNSPRGADFLILKYTERATNSSSYPLPRPFNLEAQLHYPSTSPLVVSFTLPAHANVTMSMHDLTGRMYTSLESVAVAPGTHVWYIDVTDYPSGIYVLVLRAGTARESAKITILR